MQLELESLPDRPPSERDVWAGTALTVIELLSQLDRGPITADDVRRYAGPPPDKHIAGTVFRRARAARLIRPTGIIRRSTSPSRRASLLTEWETTPALAARHQQEKTQ